VRHVPKHASKVRMTAGDATLLSDRGVVAVTGPDAAKLLQGLVTNDVADLKPGQAVFAGLLSPQGKILSDFLVVAVSDGFLIDVARDKATELVKRLSLYRLRSKAEISDRSAEFSIVAGWGGEPVPPTPSIVYRDPRLSELGWRGIAAATDPVVSNGHRAGDYHAHRIALGVPEGGRDYAYGDTFPHEALFDQLHGVSFEKGCYVGQEIVSRMQHRGTARKRIVPVRGEADLPAPGTPVSAGGVEIGMLGSNAARDGLALVRLDRAAEFKSKGVPLTAGDVTVTLAKPAFATFTLEPQQPASQS
jgi:folate-binding protein YgfZ